MAYSFFSKNLEEILADIREDKRNKKYDYSQLRENDFLCKECDERELSDDIFREEGERFSQDSTVYISKNRVIINGVESSLFQSFNFDESRIEVGPKNTEPMRYNIEHDETIVAPVMSWIMTAIIMEKEQDFPFVKSAEPIIDRKHLKTDEEYFLHDRFMSHGYVLRNPSYSEIEHCAKYGAMEARIPKTNVEEYVGTHGIEKKLLGF